MELLSLLVAMFALLVALLSFFANVWLYLKLRSEIEDKAPRQRVYGRRSYM